MFSFGGGDGDYFLKDLYSEFHGILASRQNLQALLIFSSLENCLKVSAR